MGGRRVTGAPCDEHEQAVHKSPLRKRGTAEQPIFQREHAIIMSTGVVLLLPSQTISSLEVVVPSRAPVSDSVMSVEVQIHIGENVVFVRVMGRGDSTTTRGEDETESVTFIGETQHYVSPSRPLLLFPAVQFLQRGLLSRKILGQRPGRQRPRIYSLCEQVQRQICISFHLHFQRSGGSLQEL